MYRLYNEVEVSIYTYRRDRTELYNQLIPWPRALVNTRTKHVHGLELFVNTRTEHLH